MRHEAAFWIGGFLAGFLIGVALSLTYTWLIDPPPLTDTAPAALNPHDKEVYTILIAASYVADGDLERTRQRLEELKDPDIENTIIRLAEDYVNQGRDARDIRALARLSDALGGTSAAMRPFIATPTATATATPTSTLRPPTRTPTRVVRFTPAPAFTATARRTATSDSAEVFEVAQSTALCDPTSSGLLRVYIRDRMGKGVPGVQILVNWPGGEDSFYTGFKPETDSGYADFVMEPGEVYQVELIDVESDVAQEIGADLAELCPDLPPDVLPSWQIVFQIGQ
jgi:hypothetical protein